MNHLTRIALFGMLSALLVGGTASAHVGVKPSQVDPGAFTTFNVSVPGERDFATEAVTVTLPLGLQHVTPTVKPGWAVVLKTETRNGEDVVTGITWTGGKIPAHMRDEFTFSAQAPATTTTLVWKAYQMYEDGTLVSWDRDPNAEQPKNAEGKPDFSKFGPYSVTQVANDPAAGTSLARGWHASLPLYLSIAALILAIASLVLGFKR